MKEFYKGIVVGLVIKDTVTKLLKTIVFNTINAVHVIKSRFATEKIFDKNLINNVYFICKITNHELITNTIQPSWEYFSEKKIIKIELDYNFIDFLNNNQISTTFGEFSELKDSNNENYITLDIPYFQSFGEVYYYINYQIESQRFINVYSKDSTICSDDFKIINTKMRKNFENLICSSIKISNSKNEYISNYLKLFYNNNNPITPSLLVNNYDKINTDCTNIKLISVTNSTIKEYSADSVLNE